MPTKRRNSTAITTACNVLPVAMIAAEASAVATPALAAMLPIQMPGQRRLPRKRSAVAAMPEAGQIGVA